MKWLRRLLWLAAALVVAGTALYFYLPHLNGYRQDGQMALPGLNAPVTVVRDEKGMAYIEAQNLDDALLAQGFVTAQDRIFQMQLTKMFIQGRLGEFLGDKARPSDRRMRTLGLEIIAKRQLGALDAKSRAFFERYAQGVNAFLERCPGDLPLEFRLAGVKPEAWSAVDSLSLLFYMGYSTSGNLAHELVAQAVLDKLGPDQAARLAPLNLNPDDPADTGQTPVRLPGRAQGLGLAEQRFLLALLEQGPLRLGSNNWAAGPALSAGGRPILAGDPHLDARILPGVWHPLGFILPDRRAVGANIAGLPGMALGRTSRVAMSMTNNYGDMQDLYLEKVDPADPARYLEGGRSLAFQVREETLLFKDEQAPGGMRAEKLLVRRTARGPVVSGLLPGLQGQRVVTLRWAPAENLAHDLGLLGLLTADSAAQLDQLLQRVPMLCLNWVFADADGNIGHRASGSLPIRAGGGDLPWEVIDGSDNWRGWIPPDQMPHALNPPRGWLGTCNHKVIAHDYPFYYSSFFASGHRYRRLKELMADPGPRTVDDHWRYQRDAKSLLAAQVAPAMTRALLRSPATRELGEILAGWDYIEAPDLAAPAVFNLTWYNFARLVYQDQLGPELTTILLNNLYYWEERLAHQVQAGLYPEGASGDELWQSAAQETRTQLAAQLGGQPAHWRWGRVHYLELVSPLRREGAGKTLLGSGPLPMGGSAATLLRGRPQVDQGMAVVFFASLRMVADLSDADKVAAVLPGGVCERLFSPHRIDQVGPYMSGDKLYWWLSRETLAAHTRHTLSLRPAAAR